MGTEALRARVGSLLVRVRVRSVARRRAFALVFAFASCACGSPAASAPRDPRAPHVLDPRTTWASEPVFVDAPHDEGGAMEVGLASWYGKAFAGRRTSSGERFDPKERTAAHKKLPFGTWVEVRRVDTGRAVRVRINDRGPNGHAANRIIDLSLRAAEELDMVRAGVVRVEVRVVSGPSP